MPASSAASATIILKVEPGGYWPPIALLTSGVRGLVVSSRQASRLSPLVKPGGIEGRHRDQRQHVAGVDVEDHGGRALLGAQALVDVALQIEVDGQRQVVAGLAVVAVAAP